MKLLKIFFIPMIFYILVLYGYSYDNYSQNSINEPQTQEGKNGDENKIPSNIVSLGVSLGGFDSSRESVTYMIYDIYDNKTMISLEGDLVFDVYVFGKRIHRTKTYQYGFDYKQIVDLYFDHGYIEPIFIYKGREYSLNLKYTY